MSVRRIVPNIRTNTGPGVESDANANANAAVAAAMKRNAEFYGLLGLQEVMNHGWIMTLASPPIPRPRSASWRPTQPPRSHRT